MEFLLSGSVTFNPGAGKHVVLVSERFSAANEEDAHRKAEDIIKGLQRYPEADIIVRLTKFTKDESVLHFRGQKKASRA